MPFELPDLGALSNEELAAFRAKVMATSRDARRKAITAIHRVPSLRQPWNRSLGFTKSTTPEERAEVHRLLETQLLRAPEAFLAHAWANSLVALDLACRDELLRRTGSANPKKKHPVPIPATPPHVQVTHEPPITHELPSSAPALIAQITVIPPPPPLPVVPQNEVDALAAMFDGAEEDDLGFA
jgi:hypothetical protein